MKKQSDLKINRKKLIFSNKNWRNYKTQRKVIVKIFRMMILKLFLIEDWKEVSIVVQQQVRHLRVAKIQTLKGENNLD